MKALRVVAHRVSYAKPFRRVMAWEPSALIGVPVEHVRLIVVGQLVKLREQFAPTPGVKL